MDEVPDELWLEIFQNLRYDEETLKHLRMASRTFYRISHHLLFARFSFHPYAVAGDNGLLLPSPEDVERSMERLNFWCSADVAPSVRSCVVSPWYPDTHIAGAFFETHYPYILLDKFFEFLPRFTNMKRLETIQVYFTQTGVANICRLPALDNLRVNQAYAASGQSIHLSSLSSSVSCFFLRQLGSPVLQWTSLLKPDCLCELDTLNYRPNNAGLTDPGIPLFHPSGPLFLHVHTLVLNMNPLTPSRNLAILSRFPTVRFFTVHLWNDPDEVDSIEGESVSVSPLTRRTTLPSLRRLCMFGCSPIDFAAHIDRLSIPSTITSLEIRFNDFELATLITLYGLFPRLTQLKVAVVVYMDEDDVALLQNGLNLQATTFFHALADDPPSLPTLKHLSISWDFDYDIEGVEEPDSGDPPSLAELRDGLLERCPNLSTLWLEEEHHFVLQWWKCPDGTIEERTAQTVADANTMHPQFRALWEQCTRDEAA
ncbi:hypothetical protein C8R43DRAFT_1142387 [Mycena crocata]|nr:hypothetical protein C8R43DRAFT_1142387 [Mycena crocata]